MKASNNFPAAALGVILTLVLVAGAAPAWAQGDGVSEAKVAILDVQRLMTESVAGQEALARLKELRDSKQAEGQAKQSAVEALRDQINEGRLSLSEEKLIELEKQMEAEVLALRRFGDDAERELERSRVEALQEIERQVMPLIEQIGDEMGLTYIFDRMGSGLLFAADGTDITDLVLQRFDATVAAAGE
jgi:outer membrane protein